MAALSFSCQATASVDLTIDASTDMQTRSHWKMAGYGEHSYWYDYVNKGPDRFREETLASAANMGFQVDNDSYKFTLDETIHSVTVEFDVLNLIDRRNDTFVIVIDDISAGKGKGACGFNFSCVFPNAKLQNHTFTEDQGPDSFWYLRINLPQNSTDVTYTNGELSYNIPASIPEFPIGSIILILTLGASLVILKKRSART